MTNASKWGNELRLDGGLGFAIQSSVAGLADGRFVATRATYPGPDSYIEIHGQIFNANGSRKGTEFVVSPAAMSGQDSAAVTALTDGGFAVVWQGWANEAPDVLARIFDRDGNPTTTPFSFGGTGEDWKSLPSLAALPGGGFAATWQRYDDEDGDADAMVRIFNADGSPSGAMSSFQANGGQYGYQPDIAVLSDGRIIASWEKSGVYARRFNADGSGAGATINLDSTDASDSRGAILTGLKNGGFAAAWIDPDLNDDNNVFVQVFDADGEASSAEIVVGTALEVAHYDPAIVQLADGRLVVTWTDENHGGLASIRLQLLNLDGSKVGDELLVSASTENGYEPAITTLADGRFVVSWDDFTQTEDRNGLGDHAQIFDAREVAVNLNGTPLDDDWVGTPFDDTMQGASGNDRLDGGAGDDTARYTGTRAQYTISNLGDRFVVAGPDGTDTLYNFEFVQFGSGTPERLTQGMPTPSPEPIPIPPAPEPIPNTPAGHISGLFDTRYYLSHYADVFGAGVSALDHYNTFGWHEGRAPNAFFDSTGYLAANPQVRGAGFNPLDHYHVAGWLEDRDPSASFDTTLYLIHNPDVAAAHVDPLEHYMQHGMAEGRAIYAAVGRDIVGDFDAEYYVFHNPDVAAAGVDPRAHYDQFGWHEGRKPNAWFDSAGYLAHYADVAAAGVNPLDHYEQFGWREGRDPSTAFDTLGYLAAYPDVAAAGVNPLDHYLTFGIYEGRQTVSDVLWH